MSAGKCKSAYHTDEWHGYGCSITESACMFLYPDSKACAEKYGEGPDVEETEPEEFVDNITKYECLDCGKEFILGDAAAEKLQPGFPICPYCGKSNIDWRSKAKSGDIEDMGCMEIWTSSKQQFTNRKRGRNMKVKRQVKIKTNNFILGDKIKIRLDGFGKYTATVHKVDQDGTALFIFDNCVTERQMNTENTNDGGFEKSDLEEWMNTKLISAFPKKLRDKIEQREGERKLTIPSYGEMFGHDDYYDGFEEDNDEQLELMKDRKNRVCDYNWEWCWYWIKNARKKVQSSANFAIVDGDGNAYGYGASVSNGVRPAFRIKNQ